MKIQSAYKDCPQLDLRGLTIEQIQGRVDPITGLILAQMVKETIGIFGSMFGNTYIVCTGTKTKQNG